jgi:hypothetical protein
MGIIKPPPLTGVIGLPPGQKEAGKRVDFKKDQFAFAIETKGYRIAWSRGQLCPCKSAAEQSTQPDPNCEICGGDGFLYFRPKDYALPMDAGKLDPIQAHLLGLYRAVIIRGIVTSVAKNVETYDTLGHWAWGSALCTVRHENRLNYYDRLVFIDSVTAHSEVVDVETPEAPFGAHYPLIDVNLLIDATGQRYIQGEDFQLTEEGKVEFFPAKVGPAGRYGIHYHYHPVFLVMEHAHLVRESVLKFKTDPASLTTPLGDHQPFPIQAMIKLDYLAATDQGAEV